VSVETLTMPAPAMPPVAAHDEAWLAPAVALRTARISKKDTSCRAPWRS
jgi:hypothetical protein